MNIKTPIFIPEQAMKDVFPLIVSQGTNLLKESKKIDKYGISLREVFGLCVLAELRNFLDPNSKWVFATEEKISDDGAIASINEDNKINYYEKVEQVYLPGRFLKRNNKQNMNDQILEYVAKTKDKGSEYEKDQSLFIFCDINSENSQDAFEWQDFVKKFFTKYNFLHLYFLTLTTHKSGINEYYLLSFTGQKHRQDLNGEFKFKIKDNKIFDFQCIQRINLLKSR